jgi:hypothetical protein
MIGTLAWVCEGASFVVLLLALYGTVQRDIHAPSGRHGLIAPWLWWSRFTSATGVGSVVLFVMFVALLFVPNGGMFSW